MASSVPVDTNGWIALLNSKEAMHAQANSVWRELGLRHYRVVLTDWVISETGNALSRTRHKKLFADTAVQMCRSPSVDVVVVGEDLLAKAIEYYRTFTDKSWGLVDCASFLVMRERGIIEAFTSDHHFEQAGFACLLTP